jgi:hypothetical protein
VVILEGVEAIPLLRGVRGVKKIKSETKNSIN